MDDWITPWSWPEILDRFPLTSRPVSSVPEGRKVRYPDDLAAQYGDILQYGNSYVSGEYALSSGTTTSFTFISTTTTSGPISFTLSASSGQSTTFGLLPHPSDTPQ